MSDNQQLRDGLLIIAKSLNNEIANIEGEIAKRSAEKEKIMKSIAHRLEPVEASLKELNESLQKTRVTLLTIKDNAIKAGIEPKELEPKPVEEVQQVAVPVQQAKPLAELAREMEQKRQSEIVSLSGSTVRVSRGLLDDVVLQITDNWRTMEELISLNKAKHNKTDATLKQYISSILAHLGREKPEQFVKQEVNGFNGTGSRWKFRLNMKAKQARSQEVAVLEADQYATSSEEIARMRQQG